MPSNSNNGAKASRARRLWSALHDFFKSPLNGVLALLGTVVVLGLSFVGAEELNIRANSTKFCISCHSMSAYVYEEYKTSKHYTNASGVRPECGQCHVAKRFWPAVWDHMMGTHDLVSEFSNDWTKPENFEARRAKMAEKARLKMLNEDSHTCRECHNFAAIAPTRKRGERAHADAQQKGRTNCIACHYNLVHKEAPLTDKFSQAINAFGG
ncbi:MAG: NapC/NirT family cytochrome c [Candidatus Nitricoxidivorans perseverans]|uniref:Cytochrome c-type protein n=1 Tax=Candidatus Nitricoxidivorans perseverans TaxID=2975601 RepID=A0AA49IZB9_9PROT|nr:MAG: NapC/NirT family cytochrome c [Candidatus Nitricoxidivorans perseverans]